MTLLNNGLQDSSHQLLRFLFYECKMLSYPYNSQWSNINLYRFAMHLNVLAAD